MIFVLQETMRVRIVNRLRVFAKFSVCCLVFFLGCGNSHEYYERAQKAAKSVGELLTNAGVCRSVDACLGDGYIEFAAGRGVDLLVYGISDERLIKSIVSDLCRLHEDERRKIRHDVIFYREKKMGGAMLPILEKHFPKGESCQV